MTNHDAWRLAVAKRLAVEHSYDATSRKMAIVVASQAMREAEDRVRAKPMTNHDTWRRKRALRSAWAFLEDEPVEFVRDEDDCRLNLTDYIEQAMREAEEHARREALSDHAHALSNQVDSLMSWGTAHLSPGDFKALWHQLSPLQAVIATLREKEQAND